MKKRPLFVVLLVVLAAGLASTAYAYATRHVRSATDTSPSSYSKLVYLTDRLILTASRLPQGWSADAETSTQGASL